MSNVVSASDPLTSSEITMVANLQALATSPAGQAIAKTGTNTFANVTAGGGATTNFVDNEIVSGSGTSFTLAFVPIVGSEHLFASRSRIYPSSDYSISGAAITILGGQTFNQGDVLADYRK